MTQPVPREVLLKIRKLAALPEEVRQSQWAVSVTRLTVLKGLCQQPEVAHRFLTYLAGKTQERVAEGRGQSRHPDTAKQRAHKGLMTEALPEMEAWLEGPSDDRRQRLRDLLGRVQAQQDEHQRIKWGAVRLIDDGDLLVFEYALRGLLAPAGEAGAWAYQTARHYAEDYDPSQGTGLIAASATLVQDIADFWLNHFGVDLSAAPDPAGRKAKARPDEAAGSPTPAGEAGRRDPPHGRPAFTDRQGQFLAFIYLYRKMHKQGPAETDLSKFFRVTPPAVHGMVVKLEQLGLITREPGVPRSMRVAIPAAELPLLEDVPGPPW
jgi:hypothetical protein